MLRQVATNELLRDYFPKGTDLSTHSTQHLLTVENELTARASSRCLTNC
jgi:IS30 family transposase